MVELSAALGCDRGEGGREVGVGFHVDDNDGQVELARGRGGCERIDDAFQSLGFADTGGTDDDAVRA